MIWDLFQWGILSVPCNLKTSSGGSGWCMEEAVTSYLTLIEAWLSSELRVVMGAALCTPWPSPPLAWSFLLTPLSHHSMRQGGLGTILAETLLVIIKTHWSATQPQGRGSACQSLSNNINHRAWMDPVLNKSTIYMISNAHRVKVWTFDSSLPRAFWWKVVKQMILGWMDHNSVLQSQLEPSQVSATIQQTSWYESCTCIFSNIRGTIGLATCLAFQMVISHLWNVNTLQKSR